MNMDQLKNDFEISIYGKFAQVSSNIFVIDGSYCIDKDSILSEFSKVMMFPEEWGNNWDALYDCLIDLSWIKVKEPFIIICKNFNSLKFENFDDWNTFNNILIDAIVFWREESKEIPMAILLI